MIRFETLKNCLKPMLAMLVIELVSLAIIDEDKGSIRKNAPEVSTDVSGFCGK